MRWKILSRISLENRYALSSFLKEAMEVADHTSSGSSFHQNCNYINFSAMCNKNCMYSCSSCCQSCQSSECCNQCDIVDPHANYVYLVSQECIYSNEDKVYVNNNNPNMGNHVIGNCNTGRYDHNFKDNNQHMHVKQSPSLYPGNLANTKEYNCCVSQSLTEQFGSVRPHLNPTNWGKVNNNPITMGTEVNMCTVSFMNRYCLISNGQNI